MPCIQCTFARGFSAGLLSGLGDATADALYEPIAAFGLVTITDFLVGQQPWLRLPGGAVLDHRGLKMLRARPAGMPAEAGGACLAARYISTLALTLTNPTSILSFVIMFAGLGGVDRDATTAPAMVVLLIAAEIASTLTW